MGRAKKVQIDENILFMRSLGKRRESSSGGSSGIRKMLGVRRLSTLSKGNYELTEEEFGDLLAGLIDSDGHINKRAGLGITFHKVDIDVAMYIKERLCFGNIYKLSRTEEAVNYEVSNVEGKRRVAKAVKAYPGGSGRTEPGELIIGRLRHENKIRQFNERLAPKFGMPLTIKPEKGLRDNYWLSGFVMGDGTLSVRVRVRSNKGGGRAGRVQIVMEISVKQKNREILEDIKEEMGGKIYINKLGISWYCATKREIMRNWISYFDEYGMKGSKGEQYVLFRKVWEMMGSKEHLSEEGRMECKRLATLISNMKRYRD